MPALDLVECEVESQWFVCNHWQHFSARCMKFKTVIAKLLKENIKADFSSNSDLIDGQI